ncbi:efflux RND transporter periplasmic adaptor subunit [Patescibacteria group bacterium]
MKDMESRLKGFFKRKWVKYGIIAAIAIGIAYFAFSGGEEQEYVLAEVVKGDIVQTVSVTGSIKADPSLDLHFQKTGTVNNINVNEGETVEKGDLLATIENQSLSLEVDRMKANYDYAVAQYNQTAAGAKYEEILIAQADLLSAEAGLKAAEVELANTESLGDANIDLAQLDFDKAEKDFENTKDLAEKEIEKLNLAGDNTQTVAIESAYSSALLQMDALFTEIQDALFLAENTLGVRGTGYLYLGQTTKNQLILKYHVPAADDYENAADLYRALGNTPTNEEMDIVIAKALNAADNTSLLLSQIGIALEAIPMTRSDLDALIAENSNQATKLSQSALQLHDTYSTILTLTIGSEQDIETLKLSYQLQIDQAESSLDQAEFNLEQAMLNAEIADQNTQAMVALKTAAVDTAKATLSLKKSPARLVDLAPLSAQISQADIALKLAQKALNDSKLYAPIDGLITFIYGKVGENISLTETSLSPFLSMQADNLIVEANVPETDVVKLEPGDSVAMTIDAFDFTEKLYGEVIYIDRAETIIQGVIYYEIKTAFEIDDPRLKSGMTANLEIVTDKKEDVLIIPSRAVKFENSLRYVEVLNGGPKKVQIETGLESDQYMEITSGLKQGDKIITFVK